MTSLRASFSTSRVDLSPQARYELLKAHRASRKISNDVLANRFKCSSDQVKTAFKRGKKKILSEYVRAKAKENSETSYDENGCPVKFQFDTLLDPVLYEWFQRAQMHKNIGPITNELLLRKAEEAKQSICIKEFEIDLDWVFMFRQKYNITDVDMNTLKIRYNPLPVQDMFAIAIHVVDQMYPTEQSDSEKLTDSINDDIEIENDEYCNISCDGSKIVNSETDTSDVEIAMPTISNDEEARRHLKPLEDYALMKENFRAIGIIVQLEQIFKSGSTN